MAPDVPETFVKPVMGFLSRSIRAQARALGVRYSFLLMRADGERLKALAALYDAGALRPVVDRTFPFDRTLDAIAYVEQGHAKGKNVVAMQPESAPRRFIQADTETHSFRGSA